MSDCIDWKSLPASAFGDSPEIADALLELVLQGGKKATCWSVSEGDKGTEVGARWVILDGSGLPRAVVETTELRCERFDQISEEFAAAEGEGDLSLSYWRKAHRSYFSRTGEFSPDMLLWCERFEVVEVLPSPN